MQEKLHLFGMRVYCVNTPKMLYWFKSCFGLQNCQSRLETRKLPQQFYVSVILPALFGSIAAEVSDVHTWISSLSPSSLEMTNSLLMEYGIYHQDTQCCYHKQQTNPKVTVTVILDNAYPCSNKHSGWPEAINLLLTQSLEDSALVCPALTTISVEDIRFHLLSRGTKNIHVHIWIRTYIQIHSNLHIVQIISHWRVHQKILMDSCCFNTAWTG